HARAQRCIVSFKSQIEVRFRKRYFSARSRVRSDSFVEQLEDRRLRSFSYAAVRTDVRRLAQCIAQHSKRVRVRSRCCLRQIDLAHSRRVQWIKSADRVARDYLMIVVRRSQQIHPRKIKYDDAAAVRPR